MLSLNDATQAQSLIYNINLTLSQRRTVAKTPLEFSMIYHAYM